MPSPSICRKAFIRLIAILLLTLGLISCSSKPINAADLTFIVVRHAEKMTAENSGTAFDAKDPPLTEQGAQRAAALASALRSYPLVAAYATPFQRTLATAVPTARAFGLSVQSYEANQAAAELVTSLRQQYKTGAVLVVGHSNTVPAIVAELCRCTAPPLVDTDYGDRFEVRIDANGRASFAHLRF